MILYLAEKCRPVILRGKHFNVIYKTNFNSNLSVISSQKTNINNHMCSPWKKVNRPKN